MASQRRTALIALATAGVVWGLTVPVSKVILAWLSPGWLGFARFALAAPVLAIAGRRGLRAALTPRIILSGAVGFGVVVVLQNAGLARTSVSHAAVLLGVIPVLIALIAAGVDRDIGRPRAWGGYAVALVGVTLVAGSQGGGATFAGDLLVLSSAALSAGCIAVQPRLLEGRDAAAVTAVQFGGAALASLPLALAGGAPGTPQHAGQLAILLVLALVGTPLPFWLFAYGQARVPAQLAGNFVNLEPVVGAAVGWLAFGDAAATWQLTGAAAVLGGIAIGALPEDLDLVQRSRNSLVIWRRLDAPGSSTPTAAISDRKPSPPGVPRPVESP